MSISGMTTGGQQFPFDQFSQAQKRGMRYRPFGGVLEGLVVSGPANLALTGATLQVSVTAGKAKLDAQDVALAAGGTATLSLAGYNLINGYNSVSAFLSPTRLVPVVFTPPLDNAGADFDRVLHVTDAPDGQVVLDIYEKLNGSWEKKQPWHGAIAPGNPMSSYTKPAVEAGSGNLSMAYNEISPALAVANITAWPEKYVYFASQIPIQFAQPQKPILRQSASFLLAQLTLDILRLPLQVVGTGSASTILGNFAPLLKAGAAVTDLVVNGLGLTDEPVTAISADGQVLTVGTALPTGTGLVTVTHDTVPEAHFLSGITGANSVRNFNGDATILI